MDADRLELFSHTVGTIYDAALEPAKWPEALDAILRFTGSRVVALQSYDVLDNHPPWDLTLGYAPEWLEKLRMLTLDASPLGAVIGDMDTGEAGYGSAHPLWPAVLQSAYYHEWAKPQGLEDIAGLVFDKTTTTIGTLVLGKHIDTGMYDDRINADLTLLFPHVRRAVLIGRTIGGLQDETRELSAVLDRLSAGVVLLTPTGAIVRTNAAAEVMLATAAPIARSAGAVLLPGSVAQRALMRTLSAFASGETGGDKGVSIPVAGADGAEFLIHILPLDDKRRKAIEGGTGAVAILFVRPRASGHAEAAAALSERFRLTAREREVLEALVDVGGVPMIAEMLGVSNTTVRTHVTNIFDKTGVRRQTDLIKLMMEMAAPPV